MKYFIIAAKTLNLQVKKVKKLERFTLDQEKRDNYDYQR